MYLFTPKYIQVFADYNKPQLVKPETNVKILSEKKVPTVHIMFEETYTNNRAIICHETIFSSNHEYIKST